MTLATTAIAQGVMDVHSHIITSEFVSALEQEVRLMDEGFPLPKYDVTEHLKWMDEAGIETSVLTLAAPQPTSAEVVRKSNEAAARIRKEHPGRFMFCAALPLPDVQKAIEEAKYALDVLKADGIKLATNVDGQYLGAPELDTLFAVLNERKAVVILHPHRPEPVNKQVMAQTPLAMQEYLSETTRAVTNMISRNVLARFPNVKREGHRAALRSLSAPGRATHEVADTRDAGQQDGGRDRLGGEPSRAVLRPRRRTQSRDHPHDTHHYHARPPALRLRLSIRRSAGAHTESGKNEGLSLERARSGTIQGDDSVEECEVVV